MDNKQQKVAFLGPKASFTHQATINQFPEASYQVVPHTTIEDVFAAVQNKAVHVGVVPFENSSNGTVAFTLDLLANERYLDVLVCGEIYLPVQHYLLGRFPKQPSKTLPDGQLDVAARLLGQDDDSADVSGSITPTIQVPEPLLPRARPRCSLAHLETLYSHPQAWGQCNTFLSTYLKTANREQMSSTSKSAQHVAADTSGTSAAICSKLAADLYDLDILAEGIEDNEKNCTRFFIIRRKENLTLESISESEKTAYKSFVLFTVDHDRTGSLASSLGVFNKHDLNLTNIVTRPSGDGEPWHYIFYVEFQGGKRLDDEGGAVNEALEQLGEVAKSWRWLGSWRSALKS